MYLADDSAPRTEGFSGYWQTNEKDLPEGTPQPPLGAEAYTIYSSRQDESIATCLALRV